MSFVQLANTNSPLLKSDLSKNAMLNFNEKYERFINFSLLAMLAIVVLMATVDLGWIILKDVLTPPLFLLDVDELLELFGAFLLVMIGLKLLDTVKIYITQKRSATKWCCWWGSSRSPARS